MNRRRVVWLGGSTAAVLMVMGGVTTNQVLNNGVWSWPWFAAALMCTVGTVLVERRMTAADQPRPVLRRDLVGEGGRPLLVGQITPRQLGVHPSRFGAYGDSPYVERDVDAALVAAMRDGSRRFVVVQGPRLAGTTSALAQAAQTELAEHYMLAFVDDPRLTVEQMIVEGRRWAVEAGAVLWLDELTPSQLIQLDRALLESMPAGLWILATVHDKNLKGFRTPEHVALLLEEQAVHLTIGTISGHERDAVRAEDVYADLRPILDTDNELLMGRLMVALDQIQNALTLGRDEESADQVSLLRAVTDWYRVAMPVRLTERELKRLYAAYRAEAAGREHGHDEPVSIDRFTRALSWVSAKASPKRPQLVHREETGRSVTWYVPHPLLTVVADDTGQPGAWPVGDPLWTYADRYLTGDQRRDIGYAALDLGANSEACRLLDHDDTDVEPAALQQVAVWLAQTGEMNAAQIWFMRVIATGHPDEKPLAMVNLGVLEKERGNPDQARRWYTQAIATDHPDEKPKAMVNLGVLEKERGNPDQARRWYTQAIATDHPDEKPKAMVNLGVLEKERGNPDQARHWYTQAIATDHPDQKPLAMINLGLLEGEQGNPDQARHWFTQAIATDHPDEAPGAMISLGVLEKEQGNLDQARHWYTQAIATDHPDEAPGAMVNLGVLEVEQGNPDQARRWWRKAVSTDHPDQKPLAMGNLGLLEDEEGNPDQARHWYTQAIATDHPDEKPKAMVNLGVLEKEQGNLDQARHWYTQAIATDHPDEAPGAMINLGILEIEQGNPDQARRWWRKAVSTDHPDQKPLAMVNLGVLEKERGNPDQARRWFTETIATGHPVEAPRAERELRELDRLGEAHRRADHFARYGWQAYADPKLLKSNDPGQSHNRPND